MPKDRKILLILAICIFLLALLPRLFLSLRWSEIPTRNTDGYEDLAKGLLEGKGFSINGKPTSFHEPFYPAFLGAIYYFFGYSYLAVRIIQGLLGAAICVMIFFIARRSFGLHTAIIASLLACFSPGLVSINQLTMSENLFTFMFILSAFFLARQVDRPDIKNIIFLGLTLGLSAMIRSLVFLFPFFILLALRTDFLPRHSSAKKYTMHAAIFILCFLLPIAPWTLRNWRIHQRFVPIATKTGNGFYASYLPKDGKLYGFTATGYAVQEAESFYSEVDQSNFLIKETLRYIKNNPWRVLKLEALKLAYFLSPFDWEIVGNGVYNVIFGFILPFFVYGMYSARNRSRELLPIYLPIAYAFFVMLITYGSPRYRLPFEPYMIIIASAGISHFVLRFSNKITGIILAAAYFLLNLALYFNSSLAKSAAKLILERIHLW